MVQNNILAEKSTEFGTRMVRFNQFLCKEKKVMNLYLNHLKMIVTN